MSTSQASRALGRGRTITFINGDTYRVVFSLYTLAVLEDEFGSLDALDEAFKGGSQTKMIRTVGKMLANALCNDAGEPVDVSEDFILRQIDISDIGSVFADLQAGLTEAFRQGQPAAATVDTAQVESRIAAMTKNEASLGSHFSTSGALSSINPSAKPLTGLSGD